VYWHSPEDTYDKMDPEVMERTWAFTTALIAKIDAAASPSQDADLKKESLPVLS
jgi:hypothetical protein